MEDDEQRLKVSHHPDGFLEFSGHGIRSGRDDAGNPKGIGTVWWPLTLPTLGPAFSLAFSNAIACGRPTADRVRTVLLPEAEIEHMRKDVSGVVITGYYFPVRWRELSIEDTMVTTGLALFTRQGRQ